MTFSKDETEYGLLPGKGHGVDKRKSRRALSSSEEARLMRLVGEPDPTKPKNDRIWNGEIAEKTPRQLEAEAIERRRG